MASVDTSVQLAARAASREELVVRAQALLEQSRAMSKRLAERMGDQEVKDEEEGFSGHAEYMEPEGPTTTDQQRSTVYMALSCAAVVLVGVVALVAANCLVVDEGRCGL